MVFLTGTIKREVPKVVASSKSSCCPPKVMKWILGFKHTHTEDLAPDGTPRDHPPPMINYLANNVRSA